MIYMNIHNIMVIMMMKNTINIFKKNHKNLTKNIINNLFKLKNKLYRILQY
jgi:hypothetical protein